MQRCCPAPPPPLPPRKFEIIFALRRIGNGILAGFAVVFAVAVLAAPDAQAQDAPCTAGDIPQLLSDPSHEMQISMQIDNCNAKGWGAKKHPFFENGFKLCYCDIKAIESKSGQGGCGSVIPSNRCRLSGSTGNTECAYYFGATLQYLPERTEANKDSCFVSHCPGGQEPSGANMNGEMECACPAGQFLQDSACVAPSVESCGGLSPAKFYDAAAGECVAVAECAAPAVLNAGANRCDCPAPNVGTDGADAPGDCVAASAESCGGLTPAKFYDAAAGACVAVADCLAPAVLDAGANLCDCPSPNIGTDGAVAPGDCAVPAPSVENCEELIPSQFYSTTPSACVPFVECVAPSVLDAGANLCDCPSPNVGTDGASAPGDCVAPSVESCGGLSPAKFYDAAAGACVAVVECVAPSVLDAGANLCDCPSPNVGTDGASAPGDCVAPSVESCRGLTPAKFYDAAAGECVAFASCTFADISHKFTAEDQAQVSLQIDNCNAKGWGAIKHDFFSSHTIFELCYCNIKARDNKGGGGGCGPYDDCEFSNNLGNEQCQYYFGATLQYLPQRTEENKNSCFVAYCQNGQEPSAENMNGETECACPAGEVFHGGACVAASAESCGGLTPAKFYDAAAGECVAVAECAAPAVLNAGANLCDCPAPNVGADEADAPGDCVAPRQTRAAAPGDCGAGSFGRRQRGKLRGIDSGKVLR